MSKEGDWKKDMREMLKPIEDSLGKMSSNLNEHLKAHENPPSPEGEGSDKMPEKELLKCRGKDCGFSTHSVEDYIEHRLNEVLPKPPAEEPKRHKSVDDFLNCPECFPRFEEAFLKRGYTKPQPQEKKPEGKKGLI